MADLVLHIGLHKTGTTLIQDTFTRNADLLARHGLYYPRIGQANGHHGLAYDWNPYLPVHYRLPQGSPTVLAELATELAHRPGTVFLSSEELSRAEPGLQVDLASLRRWLAPFGRIRVLCTLRAQWRFLQSIWLEVAKRHAPPITPIDLVRGAISTHRARGLWADFNELYDHLLETFPPEDIVFLDHATASSGEGGLLGAVLRAVGSEMDPALLTPVNDGRSNTSPEPLASWAAATIAAPYPAPATLVTSTTVAFQEQFSAEARSTLFTAAELDAVKRHFAPSNARLAERLAPHQPGFAVTGQEAEEELVFRDRIDAWFWLRCNRHAFYASLKPAADRDVAAGQPRRG
ncbi:hypothetical protein [Falsirhodobacter sp. 20TX0035]|uniref:hypothetical protein n=1 Tax=Falsirhodobacter sp. 20TX0035 TaxID=3022019 RepID=UPI00232B7A02|nr:hypothetical protein [Falsirhodobacter sp. 20TX0035]MDB6452703.1 hypothetical protein [Falsirhodobacter sp. 20TX0035]